MGIVKPEVVRESAYEQESKADNFLDAGKYFCCRRRLSSVCRPRFLSKPPSAPIPPVPLHVYWVYQATQLPQGISL